jgi:HPt (histidine-containing phosphotransfer) domain-containing protein
MEEIPRTSDSPPLHSTYENDPDLRDLVMQFVDELDGQVRSIRSACLSEDFAMLRRISHQLKGAAGGYGFDPIGDCAARLEDDMLGDEMDIAGLSERVEDLITTCRAAVRPADS